MVARKRLITSVVALAFCVLFVSSVNTQSSRPLDEKQKYNVKWVDAEPTWKEKAVELSKNLNENMKAAGGSLVTLLKNNGIDVGKVMSTVRSKLKNVPGFKDTRPFSEKFQDVASKVQKSLEDSVFDKVKEMGAQMVNQGGKGDDQPKAAKKKDAKVSDGPETRSKAKEKKKKRNENVQEIIDHLESGATVEQISLELQEGLLNALKKVSPDADTVKAELSKAKQGVEQISLWAEELFKNGVSVNEIKDILRKAGLTPVEQENIEDMDIPHEEL